MVCKSIASFHKSNKYDFPHKTKQSKGKQQGFSFLFFSFLKQIFISYLCIFICMKKYCCKNFSIPDAKITFFFLFQFFQFFHSHLCAQSKKKKQIILDSYCSFPFVLTFLKNSGFNFVVLPCFTFSTDFLFFTFCARFYWYFINPNISIIIRH